MATEMTQMFETQRFSDVFGDSESFVSQYKSSGYYDERSIVSDRGAITTYYLLLANYGNDPISNLDVNQFKNRLFATIFMYGPVWEKQLILQESLRSLSESELEQGTITINNHAFNPGTSPNTTDVDMLTYINDQATSRQKLSKAQQYQLVTSMLEKDFNREYLVKFKSLFKKVVFPERPLLYATEDDE